MNLLVLVVTIVALLVTVDALFGGLANKKASSTVGKKVVVLGGTGFVGSRITQQLSEGGNKVIAISRSGEIPEWAQSYDFVNNVEWIAGDVNDAAAMQKVMRGASSVVSAVGAIGFDKERLLAGNGESNVAAITSAKKAGVKKFVYVSVASLVKDAFGDKILQPYFEGKAMSEAALAKNFPSSGVVVGPSFIYGGDSFSLAPPRVPNGYGSFINKILSTDAIRKLADASPAPIAVVLAPPVSVAAVAGAAATAATGNTASRIDGTDDIVAASGF